MPGVSSQEFGTGSEDSVLGGAMMRRKHAKHIFSLHTLAHDYKVTLIFKLDSIYNANRFKMFD